MRVLLSNLLAGTSEPEDINNLRVSVNMAGSRELFEDETLLDSDLLLPTEIQEMRPGVLSAYALARTATTFVKVHDAWTYLSNGEPQLGRGARAALYLVRDPRDVAISLAAFDGTSLDTAIERINLRGDCCGPTNTQVRQQTGDWSEHVRSWLDQAEVPVCSLRYEDLLADTQGEFRRVPGFLGGDASDEAIANAVRNGDFQVLRRQEQENGFRERSRQERVFFRSGRAEQWRTQLNGAQIRSIEDVHGDTMARLGYELVTR